MPDPLSVGRSSWISANGSSSCSILATEAERVTVSSAGPHDLEQDIWAWVQRMGINMVA